MLPCPPLPVSLPQFTQAPPGECSCRCGVCCREMVIRVGPADVAREPRLAELGHPVECDENGRPMLWMLNVLDATARQGVGPCQFLAWDDGAGVCTIHETRPDVCRRLDCDGIREFGRKHLAEWKAALADEESRRGLKSIPVETLSLEAP